MAKWSDVEEQRLRAARAERDIRDMAVEVRRYVSMTGARCVMLEAALTVIRKHNLLTELVHEHAAIHEAGSTNLGHEQESGGRGVDRTRDPYDVNVLACKE